MKREEISYVGGHISLIYSLNKEKRRNDELLKIIEKTQSKIDYYESELAELSKRKSTSKQKQNLIELLNTLQNNKYSITIASYKTDEEYPEEFTKEITFNDIDLHYTNIEKDIDNILENKSIIRHLNNFLMKQDYGNAYVLQIVDENGNTIYYHPPIKENLSKYSVELLIEYYSDQIKKLDYNLSFYKYYHKSKKQLLERIPKLVNNIYNCLEEEEKIDEKKEEIIEYLLLNATDPDVSEDEYDIYKSLDAAENALLKSSKYSTGEVIKYIQNLGYPIDTSIVYSILLNFGGNSGLKIYKEGVVDIAREEYIKSGWSQDKETYEYVNKTYLKHIQPKSESGEDE